MLDKVNTELKGANIGVVVEQRGKRLYIRGTFPPKPGSGKTKPHQQILSLGIYANPAGFRRAKAEAIRVGGLLACKEFSWEAFGFSAEYENEIPTIASWLERFEENYFQRHARNPKSKDSYKVYLWAWRNIFGSAIGEPMTAEVCLDLLLRNTEPDSSTRETCIKRLSILLKFAGISLDLEPYRGNYQQPEIILPTDEEIVAWGDKIDDPTWRWRYAVMATYGIRNHELFYLNLSQFHISPILRVKTGTKTGARSVWPYKPEWYARWNLGSDCYPPKLRFGVSNSNLGKGIWKGFDKLKIPFHPYALRHAWAVRTLAYGLDVAAASLMMGHSVTIHCKTYHKWISEAHLQTAWEKSIN